jgi:hypothetical protein
MVERVSAVLFDNVTLSVQRENLQSRTEGVHEYSKEEYCATLEEGVSVRLHVVKDGANDECHDDVAEELSECQTGVTPQTLETTPQAKFDLLTVRESIRRLATRVLGLLCAARVNEFLCLLATNGVLLVVDFDILEQLSTLGAGLPACGELFGSSWNSVRPSLAHHTLL